MVCVRVCVRRTCTEVNFRAAFKKRANRYYYTKRAAVSLLRGMSRASELPG